MVFKVVPVEPTREMWAAAGDAVVKLVAKGVLNHDKLSEAVWSAMVAAAPVQPVGAGMELAESALCQAGNWFSEYADGHTAQGKLDKAQRNADRALFCWMRADALAAAPAPTPELRVYPEHKLVELLASLIDPISFAAGYDPDRGCVQNDIDKLCEAARDKARQALSLLAGEGQ